MVVCCMETTAQFAQDTRPAEPQQPVRYCLYARKSSEQDEAQALSIDSQVKEMLALAQRDGLEVIDIKRESHSAKETGQRPVFNEIVNELRDRKFEGILTWAPDRISRNAGDLGKIVDLMDLGFLREIRTFNQRFSNNPNEKFLLMILGSQAKLENDNKRINVKRGLKTRAEMGLFPGMAPIGYLNDKRADHRCEIMLDPLRASVVKRLFEMVGNEGISGKQAYLWLRDEVKLRSRNDKSISLSTVYNALANPLYTGVFEYPRKSGNWYAGRHPALITKELFERVRAKMAAENKPRKRNAPFAFVRLMKCGMCGSGVTAMEKSKSVSDGTTHWYIYYACTRYHDKHCKNPYIREDSLILQLGELIDQLDIDELGARQMIEREVTRYNKLRATMLGVEERDQAKEMDVKRYAKYLLEEGTIEQKRELLEQLRGRIVMADKKIRLESPATDPAEENRLTSAVISTYS